MRQWSKADIWQLVVCWGHKLAQQHTNVSKIFWLCSTIFSLFWKIWISNLANLLTLGVFSRCANRFSLPCQNQKLQKTLGRSENYKGDYSISRRISIHFLTSSIRQWPRVPRWQRDSENHWFFFQGKSITYRISRQTYRIIMVKKLLTLFLAASNRAVSNWERHLQVPVALTRFW